jgi:hypothetical protein
MTPAESFQPSDAEPFNDSHCYLPDKHAIMREAPREAMLSNDPNVVLYYLSADHD